MRKIHVGFIGVAVAALGVLGLVAPVVAHQESTVQSNEPSIYREQVKQRVHGRLDEAKRNVCETRKTAIAGVMQRAADAGRRHLMLFNNIHTRVTEFYADKQLTIAGYDALTATAKAKYDAAAAAVNAVKDASGFDCNGDNPVGTADQYKGKVKAMHDALKDYRSSVHVVLVAVKTAASASEGDGQ